MIFHWYGFFIGLGVLIASMVVEKIQKELIKQDKDFSKIEIDSLLYFVFIPGLIFARMYHVLDYFSYYRENFVKIYYVWEGGLAIYGGIFGGILGVLIYSLIRFGKEWNNFFPKILNLLVFGVPIAAAIGRLGNFFNQELFGKPTNLFWGIKIDLENRPGEFLNFERFHPLFLYEGLLNLLLFWFLVIFFKKKKEKGLYFCYYLIGYGLIRFSLDYLRIDPWKVGLFSVAQWISLGIIGFGTFFVLKNKRGAER